MKKKEVGFPKDFFNQKMTNVTLKEALEDITPINLDKNDNQDLIIYSVNEKEGKYNKKNST